MSHTINNSPYLPSLEVHTEAMPAETSAGADSSFDQAHAQALHADTYLDYALDSEAFDEERIAEDPMTETARQQIARAQLLCRLTRAISRSLDPAEVPRTAVGELGAHLNVDRCTLLTHDATAGVIRTLAQYVAPGVSSLADEYPAARFGKMISALRERGVICFDDVESDSRLTPEFVALLRSVGVRSVMYVAVRLADETPAALALSTVRSARRWQMSDIALVRAVADQTAVALRQAQLFEQAQANSRRERLINRLGEHIRASLDLSEMLHTATHELGRALGASRVHLRPFDAAQSAAHSAHAYTAPGVTKLLDFDVSYDDPLGRHLLGETRVVVIHDAAHHNDLAPEVNAVIREQASHTGALSEIICPLVVQGAFRGVLCIHQTDRLRRWTADETALVETVAAQLATGMAQAELFEMVTRAKKEWEATFDAMSDGVIIFDNEKRLTRINRAGALLEDSYPHLLMGRRCCDILRAHGADAECVVERAIAEARSTTLEVTPASLQRPLLVTVEPIMEQGRPSGAVCTVRDLSELHEVQTEARQSQSLLMNILESAREAIFALDSEGRVQWCNGGALRLSAIAADELIGRNAIDLVIADDRPKLRRAFKRALAGESLTCEVAGMTGNGELRFTLVDYAPLVIEGRTTGVLGIARDITEQKREREHAAQADKLRALGQLASGVAHDLNNSLAAILGRAQLLQRAITNSAQLQHLEVVNTAAEDAAATVRRIQTFARQSAEKEFELLDLRALLRDAIEITRTRWENEARAAGRPCEVELAIEADNSAPLAAMGVASELREVFVNLILNAVDAMPEGGRLRIIGEQASSEQSNSEQANGCIRLHFADSGTGMTPEVRAHIFEPFYTTKGVHGTGLGLFVSYGIIERHRGSIEVRSELGRGTTFTIEIPTAPIALEVERNENLSCAPTPALAVLIVDDELFVRSTLGEMLGALGHRVVIADGGAAARTHLERESFEVVLTDLSMPDMDGWEVARLVRDLQPAARTLLVTGYGATVTPPAGEEHIIAGIVSKPFDFARVAEALAREAADS